MVRLTVETGNEHKPDTIEVSPGGTLLIGRDPVLERALNPEAVSTGRQLAIPSHSVSANHVLVKVDGDATTVRDLGSRNGTWLRLPPHQDVRVPPTEELSLSLAIAKRAQDGADEPRDARWTSARDFASSVSAAVAEWLRAKELPARVTVSRRGDDTPAHTVPLPVGDDALLHIVPLRTTEALWPEIMTNVWRWMTRQNARLKAEEQSRKEGMILASDAIRAAHERVMEAAQRGSRLLIIGPSGVGKEGLARSYHRCSGRSGPFIALNCSLFSHEMLRIELFGAERGAFTGSVRRIIGAVERANGGTLFLDEIGELPHDLQPQLLRFLDRGEYNRLGKFDDVDEADVRIVCATNKDLRAAVAAEQFRLDLWFRLSSHVVEVAPLRERLEDLEAYLKTRPYDELRSVFDALSPDARQQLREYEWQGNFRELANFVDRLSRRPGPIDAGTCRTALAQGALTPLPPATPTARRSADAPIDWLQLATTAAAAFTKETAIDQPRTLDEIKLYYERFLKPLLFAEVSGAARVRSRDELDLRSLAELMGADRATVVKQWERYRALTDGA
jgi:hypothetical protein